MNKYIHLAVFLLLTACGGGSDNKGKPQTESENQGERETLVLDCSTITSNAEQATQGGVVTVNSSTPIQHAYYLHQKADQSTQEIEIILRKNSDDYLIAIPYLRKFDNGGTMNLAISASRESNRCNLPAITLSALPAADKSVADDLFDQVESMINNYKSMVGFSDSTTKEDYQSDPLLFSAALANAYFFDPESEISLPYVRNLISKLTDEEKTFVAQVIQDSDLIEQVKAASNNYKQSVASVAITEKNVQTAIAHLSLNPIARNPATEFANRKIANSSCTNALNNPAKHRVQITDLKSLSAAMKLAKDANDKLAQSAANPSSTKDNITSTVGAAAAILGGPGGALVGAISALPGIVNFVNEHSLKQIAGLLPSSLGEINVSIIPKTRLEEDFTDKASNPFWNAKFSAKSKGLNLSKQIVDAAFTVAGAAPSIPAISNINMAGVSKASGKVFNNNDAGTDCGLIIAPQSWNVAADNANTQYYSDELEGDAFVLEQNRKLKPVKIGSSKLTVKLKSNLFPSEGSTLDTFEQSIDIANVRKQYSASSTVLIEKAGNNANVDITAIDIANVESYQLKLGDGLDIISEQVSDNQINLTLGTTTDEKKYPLSLTITSTSKDLEPSAPPRNKTIKIDVSPIKVTITKNNEVQCNNEDAYEVNLTAVVEGAKNDQGVNWSFEGTGAVLSPSGNDAFFTTSNTNTFTIKATSKEDPEAFDTLIIKPRDCKANIYLNSQSSASIESPSVDCNVASNPTKFEADDVTLGTSLEDIQPTPNGIKTLQLPLSEGLTKSWDSSIQEKTTSSYQKQEGGGCESFTVTQSGKTKGSISADNDNGVTLNQTLSNAGRCYIKEGGSEPICEQGKALTIHNIFWLFDHSGATSYELTNDMVCTTPPLLSALPSIPNVTNLPTGAKAPTNSLSDLNQNLRYFLYVFDQNGQQIAPNIETNQFWNPIVGTQCYKDATPVRSNTWNIPDFGQPATVIINVIFNDAVIDHNTSQAGTLGVSGNSIGTIRVQANKPATPQ